MPMMMTSSQAAYKHEAWVVDASSCEEFKREEELREERKSTRQV